MKAKKIKNIELESDDVVHVTEMGNIIEVRYLSRKNRKQRIQMLKDRKYLNLSTGEIKECKERSKRRSDRINNLYCTFRRLRAIINTNIVDTKNVHWVTLTYAENMKDTKKLYSDFQAFNKRYKYYLKKRGIDQVEYIAIAEPQGRGAWHLHLLYIYKKRRPFVPNEKLRELWEHGFVMIRSLESIDNVGAYLTAYLTDIPVEDVSTMYNANEDKKMATNDENGGNTCAKTDKKYIKGGRMLFYPANFNLYRCSRGIKRPITQEKLYKEAVEKIGNGIETYRKTVELSDIESDFKLVIHTEYYNKMRKNGNN